jgi:glycerol-3-phosphate dehydrogenase (NAD(P)+)
VNDGAPRGLPKVPAISERRGGMNVTVLGAGSWGTTLASLVAARHETVLWSRDKSVSREIETDRENRRYLAGYRLPSQLHATHDLESAVSRAEVLVIGVPTHGFRDVLVRASKAVPSSVPVVSLSKGFEQGTRLRMTEVIEEVLLGHPAAALTGPNIAREIMEGKAAASVVAAKDLDVAAELQKVLTRGVFRVYVNHDVIGCEIGGALKNVVAIAAGIGQGLGVGDNTRSAVMARGLAELTRLGVAMGAEAATFAGLAGMGDLIATCVSPYSRNRMVGERLGRGESLQDILGEMLMVAEGVTTAKLVLALAAHYDVDLPICRAIHQVVTGEISPERAYLGLRPAGHEADPG